MSMPVGPWRLALRRLRRDRGAMTFGGLLALLILMCLAAPLWAAHVAHTGPLTSHVTDTIDVGGERVFVVALDGTGIGPTWREQFFLGADQIGRDFFVRLLYGGRNSLMIGFAAATVTALVGSLSGLVAGYFGGWTDTVISRGLDLLWSFPVLLLGVAMGTALALGRIPLGPFSADTGAKATTVLVIGVISVPYLARPVRARAQVLRHAPFVEAAELMGAGRLQIVLREVLPNVSFTVLALFPVLIANAIVLESALSFLGAGIRPPEPSWGSLIKVGLDHVTASPHQLIASCTALTITVLCVNVLGESVRRALDPHT